MPVQPLDAGLVTALVRDAAQAPSMHNAQPWKFRFRADSATLELRADPERSMPHSDPGGRALHLGCGAALFNLRVAAANAGREAVVQLLPDPDEPELLATARLDNPAPADTGPAALYPALHRRHTSRSPFTETEVPALVRSELCEAARMEGAQLVFPGVWHVESILDLIQDAEGRDSLEPGHREEVDRWIRVGAGTSATDGIPEYAFGPRKFDGRAPVRDFAGQHPVANRAKATFENTPQLALLGTAEDRPSDWLRAGQAMERVLLVATREGLATSLTSQALEWPDLRRMVRDPQTPMGFVQMVLRLGYGPQGCATPRRPVQDVLDLG